jgi:hypothetical protein
MHAARWREREDTTLSVGAYRRCVTTASQSWYFEEVRVGGIGRWSVK